MWHRGKKRRGEEREVDENFNYDSALTLTLLPLPCSSLVLPIK
jgi:hypothetical protein